MPKWIDWVSKIFLICLFACVKEPWLLWLPSPLPPQDSDSSCLLVLWSEYFKDPRSCRSWNLIPFLLYPQVETFFFWGTIISKHTGHRDARMGSKTSLRGSQGIMISSTLPTPTLWFLEPDILFMLETQHHIVVIYLGCVLNPWVCLILGVCCLWAASQMCCQRPSITVLD